MRKEIGSEFQLENKELQPAKYHMKEILKDWNYTYFQSGRACIHAAAQLSSKKKVLMPEYTCQSVIEPFLSLGFEICYYPIEISFKINEEVLLELLEPTTGILYVIPYFGQLLKLERKQEIVQKCRDMGIIIIEDTTQSFFTAPLTVGDYGLCSLRKWFSLPDGAVLYGKSSIPQPSQERDQLFYELRLKGLTKKADYLAENAKKEEYLPYLKEAEQHLDRHEFNGKMHEESLKLLDTYDLTLMKQKRRNNFAVLSKKITHPDVICLLTELAEEECPFSFPIAVKNRKSLWDHLSSEEIWCPVLWPIEEKVLLQYPTASYLSGHMLSLPLDQRYGPEDMMRIAECINSWKN